MYLMDVAESHSASGSRRRLTPGDHQNGMLAR